MTHDGHRDGDGDGDELLVALDQFTNAVYWLRARTNYTAAQALAEALHDWTTDPTTTPPDQPDAAGHLRQALTDLVTTSTAASTAPILARAVHAWNEAVAAEHHRSQPFQPPPTRAAATPSPTRTLVQQRIGIGYSSP